MNPNMSRYQPSHNVHPGMRLPVLRGRGQQCELQAMRWGLVPSYTKLKEGERPEFWRMFNARSDGVLGAVGPSSRLLGDKRCVVFLDGFYEWKGGDGLLRDKRDKQPYYMSFTDSRPLAVAALYDVCSHINDDVTTFPRDGSWDGNESSAEGTGASLQQAAEDRGGATAEPLCTVTLLTTDASSSLNWLHDRMPVLLDEAGVEQWLSDTKDKVALVRDLLRPYEGEDLTWHPVTKRMSKLNYTEPDCCAPVKIDKPRPITQFFGAAVSAPASSSSSPGPTAPSKAKAKAKENGVGQADQAAAEGNVVKEEASMIEAPDGGVDGGGGAQSSPRTSAGEAQVHKKRKAPVSNSAPKKLPKGQKGIASFFAARP